jgi:hypothetical protein
MSDEDAEPTNQEGLMSDPVFTTFAEVQAALDTFVSDNNVPVGQAPHGVFWHNGATQDDQYNNFVTGDAIPTFPILIKGDGAKSNIILALSGQAPFDGSELPQMPPTPPGVVLATPIINAISTWITNGALQFGTAADDDPEIT